MMHRGRHVDPGKIRNVALLTIEGEKDDITGHGQCWAALDLCSGIAEAKKRHFECPRVGHYGIFNGSRFRAQIAPRISAFMRAHDPCSAAGLSIAQLEQMATMPPRRQPAADLEALAFSFAPR
jgi:poly(3-hydroxybutyrate) depolymerase